MAAIETERHDSAGNGIHSPLPAVDLAFDEVETAVSQKIRKRIQSLFNQLLVVHLAHFARRGSCEQPAQTTVNSSAITGGFVVQTTAAEMIQHPVGIGERVPPEVVVEEIVIRR